MSAQKIDGTAIAKKIRDEIHDNIEAARKSNDKYSPCLKIIQVGDNAESTGYVNMKLKAAKEVCREEKITHNTTLQY